MSQTIRALELATKFIAKGLEMGVFDGCVMSGEKALQIVAQALQAAKEKQ